MKNINTLMTALVLLAPVLIGCGDMAPVEIENAAPTISTATQALERDELNYADTAGGGIYVSGSKLTITDSDFHDNIAAGRGGAIFAQNTLLSIDCPDLSDRCEIWRNSAQQGGAIYLTAVGSASETATIENIEFRTNTAPLMYDATEYCTDEDGNVDDDCLRAEAPQGNSIAVAGDSETFLAIQNNEDGGSVEAGFQYNIWNDYSHWFGYTPYEPINGDSAHIALLTGTGALTVSVNSNQVNNCSGCGYYAPDNEVSSQNRLVSCLGDANDNIDIWGNTEAGNTEYGCS